MEQDDLIALLQYPHNPQELNLAYDMVARMTNEMLRMQRELKLDTSHAEHLAQHIRVSYVNWVYSKYNFEEYFTGRGPTANRIRDGIAMLDLISGNQLEPQFEQLGLDDLMAKFAMPIAKNERHTTQVKQLLEEITYDVFGRKGPHRCPSSPFFQTLNAEPGLHEMPITMPDGSAVKTFNLEFVANGIAATLMSYSNEGTYLLFFHPHEGVWMASDLEWLPPETYQMLSASFKHWRVEHPKEVEPYDELMVIKEIDETVGALFDQEDHLNVKNIPGYTRDTKDSSMLALHDDRFSWVFINTRGRYSGRSNYIMEGKVSRIGLENIPAEKRQKFLMSVRDQLRKLEIVSMDQQEAQAA